MMLTATEQRRRATLSGLARIFANGAERGEPLQAMAALARMLQDEFAALVDDVVGSDPEPETQETPEAPQPAPIHMPPAADTGTVRKPRASRRRNRRAPVASITPPVPAPDAFAMLGG